MRVSMRMALVAAVSVACAAGFVAAGPTLAQGAGPYTQAQAGRGDTLFQDHCALCHGTDYGGGPGAPALKGPEFVFGWKGKPAGELYTYIHDKMPPGQQGSMSDEDYAAVAAAILAHNAVPAGAQALAAGSTAPINAN